VLPPGWTEVVAALAAYLVAALTAPAGISGAVLLLRFQVSILGTPSPAVTPTNLPSTPVTAALPRLACWNASQRSAMRRIIERRCEATMRPGRSGYQAKVSSRLKRQARLDTTSSLSGNIAGCSSFRILLTSCGVWSADVHRRGPPSRAVVTRLVTRRGLAPARPSPSGRFTAGSGNRSVSMVATWHARPLVLTAVSHARLAQQIRSMIGAPVSAAHRCKWASAVSLTC
jgi:hypothetical protein